jgi:dipeptidase
VIDWSDWGGDSSKGEGGETLTVVDQDEAWVFHVTSDDTGTSAIWAAQKVPDGEVCMPVSPCRVVSISASIHLPI